MAAKLCMLLAAGIGAACVVGLARLLRNLPRLGRLHAGALLASSHTVIVCVFLAVSPLYIAAERAADSPYGDVYLPYLLVPGVHIYQPASLLFDQVFPWLLRHMESFSASVVCVVLGPWLFGLIIGGLQWYILGAAWERLVGKRAEASA